jgi:hypothetical protein
MPRSFLHDGQRRLRECIKHTGRLPLSGAPATRSAEAAGGGLIMWGLVVYRKGHAPQTALAKAHRRSPPPQAAGLCDFALPHADIPQWTREQPAHQERLEAITLD